jgi:FtsP/CotA-like multicopper oxidase with cupredoxin domain
MNGQMPGPAIHVGWGDEVVVNVSNNLDASTLNGTTLHFHGVRQLNNNMNDGVPAITQCPIAPGKSMTYTWIAEQYGSSWYHSHFAIQTWMGVNGPIIIDGPTRSEPVFQGCVEDRGSVMVTDWSHVPVDVLYPISEVVGPKGGPVTLDVGLINGKNVFTSGSTTTGSRSEFTGIVPGKKYRFRIVNSAIQSTYQFSIDNHTFTVIQNDFVPIVPYKTNSLFINIGKIFSFTHLIRILTSH